MMKVFSIILLLLVFFSSPRLWANVQSDGWVSYPEASNDDNPVVVYFRRTFNLDDNSQPFNVSVTADNRFILYVNGQVVARGPSVGDVSHWRQSELDLSPYLQPGSNTLAAVVWNNVMPVYIPDDASDIERKRASAKMIFKQTGPAFQQTVATGFRLQGKGAAKSISTDKPGWKVKRNASHTFTNGWRQIRGWYYVAGAPERIAASDLYNSWYLPQTDDSDWDAAVPSAAAVRSLVKDGLPAQFYRSVSPGKVVRSFPQLDTEFPEKALTVPANTTQTIVLQREELIAAYPQLKVSGGNNATIEVKYAEALYDKKRKKADRNLIEDRQLVGIFDSFTANGDTVTFAPLWWRAWRYMELTIKTSDQPLTLEKLNVFQTGYPFELSGEFTSSDTQLNDIFTIGWRTAQFDAHETYMDTAYWEQLQYAGDTRIQMIISYILTGDTRLAEKAIDSFADSNVEGGLIEGAYPTRVSNPIATFSLAWVGMLYDWYWYQTDTAVIERNLGRLNEIIMWWQQWQTASGLLGKNPHWNFIDWVGQPATDRDIFPSWGDTGESCLTSVLWLTALQQGSILEKSLGDTERANDYAQMGNEVKSAIQSRCWDADKRLFADNPSHDVFSQHMNALAILADMVTPQQAQDILHKIVEPGKGIDAPDGITTTSYYFAWYLIKAYQHAGLANEYLSLLKTWRELLALNYTTWPEERGDTRSDSHAWSAHPSADLIEMVAGIAPAEPGYGAVAIRPEPKGLTHFDATSATPSGPVSVRYAQVDEQRVTFEVQLPKGLTATLHWHDKQYHLSSAKSVLTLYAN